MAVCVCVRTGNELYALPVEQVLEIAELATLTAVPGAKASSLGVRNLRGEILAVFDLAAVLGRDRQANVRRLAVIEVDDQRVGLAVDEVVTVVDLPPASSTTTSHLLAGATVLDDMKVEFLNLFVMIEALRMASR